MLFSNSVQTGLLGHLAPFCLYVGSIPIFSFFLISRLISLYILCRYTRYTPLKLFCSNRFRGRYFSLPLVTPFKITRYTRDAITSSFVCNNFVEGVFSTRDASLAASFSAFFLALYLAALSLAASGRSEGYLYWVFCSESQSKSVTPPVAKSIRLSYSSGKILVVSE